MRLGSRRVITTLVLVTAWLLATAPLATAASATGINVNLPVTTKTTYSITGTVKRQAGFTVVADVQVTASGSNGYGFADTNASGVYTITHLLPGSYILSFDPPSGSNLLGGYRSGTGPNYYSATYGGAVAVTITNANLTGKGINLPNGFRISGKVTKVDGTTAIQDVQVDVDGPNGSDSTVTNASGNYTVSGLPAGSYTVTFSAPYGTNYQSGCYWTGSATNRFSPNCASTTAVVILSADRTGINVRLPLGFTISGYVKNRSGAAIANAFVSTDATASSAIDYDSALTDAAGRYVIKGVTPGTYQIDVAAPYGTMYLDGYYRAADATNHWTSDDSVATAVAVSGNVALPLIRPATGYKITGKVTTVANVALLYAYVSASETTTGAFASGVTDASGNYVLGPLPAGTYRIAVDPPYTRPDLESGYYKNVSPNFFTPFQGQATLVTIAGNKSGVNMRLPKGASISGTITAGAGALPFGTVVLAVGTTNGITGFAVSSGVDGKYKVEGLPAGTYKIWVFGTTTYPSATTVKTVATGYYKAGAPGNFTTDLTQATVITVSP